jgi:hypothetical protein
VAVILVVAVDRIFATIVITKAEARQSGDSIPISYSLAWPANRYNVPGIRQYVGKKGWGGTFWADVGALASYRGDGNWHYFGGYRYLNLEYDTGSGSSQFGVDLDYTGPMFGASYRM